MQVAEQLLCDVVVYVALPLWPWPSFRCPTMLTADNLMPSFSHGRNYQGVDSWGLQLGCNLKLQPEGREGKEAPHHSLPSRSTSPTRHIHGPVLPIAIFVQTRNAS